METRPAASSTSKVRRDYAGGKRGDGHKRDRRIRRADPKRITAGKPDPTLTGAAGLVGFGAFLRDVGVDRELGSMFGPLKSDPRVIYPMQCQLRLLMDAFVAGEGRVLGLEALAGDRLFVHLAGGVVPSIDTVYRDLMRFDDVAITQLEGLVAKHGVTRLGDLSQPLVHLDVDTSVIPRFGGIEGALPGPNPRYRGRPSHHPILARIAETDTIVGARLRPGNTGLGADDVPAIRAWVRRAKTSLRTGSDICVRVDAGGDCAAILNAIESEGAFYLIKAHVTQDVYQALIGTTRWRTVDVDADNRPARQVAEIDFRRESWSAQGLNVRVIAVRSAERQGRQLPLPGHIDGSWTVQVFLTNRVGDADEIAWDYDGRAGVEPLIAELKGAWAICEAPSYSFDANHVVLLLKMLCHNLLDRYARERHAGLPRFRTDWRRRLLVRIPGRLSRSGRRLRLHVPPTTSPPLHLRE